MLGLAIGTSEAETFWTDFLRKLARRGLRGVKLVISDAHEGLKAAIAKVLNASWQRCCQSQNRRRRFVITTDGDLDSPIFPNLAPDIALDGPNQLWVADLTYIAIATGFVYLGAILDAWSRRVVGYAISRSIDARIAVAALKAAIRTRQPPRGCVHHSDRGSQYASEIYRALVRFLNRQLSLPVSRMSR